MRVFLDIVSPLFEAATHLSHAFWFNPADNDVISADDHGDAVMHDPSQFGIDDDIVDEMEAAFPYGTREGEDNFRNEDEVPDFDNLPPPPVELTQGWAGAWDRNDAWEQLAMNRGWVRVGSATSLTACYMSAATAPAIWAATKFVMQHGHVASKLEIEISSASWSAMIYLGDEEITQFLKNGPRRAEALIRGKEQMRNLRIVEQHLSLAKWFGDSRVVDASGQPLVVYHGTNQTFSKWSKKRGGMATGPQAGAIHGFFFTNSYEEAEEYARHAGGKVVANVADFEKKTERLRLQSERLEKIALRTGRQEDWSAYEQAYAAWENYEIAATQEDTNTNVQVIAAYLSLQNPLEVDFHGTTNSELGVIEDVVRLAKQRKHDGVIMRNIYDSPLGGRVSDHYVAFSTKQIRRTG